MTNHHELSRALHALAADAGDGDDLVPYVTRRAERRRRQRGLVVVASLGVAGLVGVSAVALAGGRSSGSAAEPSPIGLAALVGSTAPPSSAPVTTQGPAATTPTTAEVPTSTAPDTTAAPASTVAPSTTAAPKSLRLGQAPACTPTPGASQTPLGPAPTVLAERGTSAAVDEPPAPGSPTTQDLVRRIRATGEITAADAGTVTLKVDPRVGAVQVLVLADSTRFAKGTASCSGLQVVVGDRVEFEATARNDGPFVADLLAVT